MTNRGTSELLLQDCNNPLSSTHPSPIRHTTLLSTAAGCDENRKLPRGREIWKQGTDSPDCWSDGEEVYLPKDAFQVFNLWHNPHRHVCWLHIGQGNVLHLLYIFINNTLTFSFIYLTVFKWFRNKTVACKFICNSSIRIVYTSVIAIKPLISWFCARPFLPLLIRCSSGSLSWHIFQFISYMRRMLHL